MTSPTKALKQVKKNFNELNIEHVEDLHLLTRIFSHPNRLANWLEEKSQLSTSSRDKNARPFSISYTVEQAAMHGHNFVHAL